MYLFFDTETTGIPRDYKAPVTDLGNWPRVVQMAFLVAEGPAEEVRGQGNGDKNAKEGEGGTGLLFEEGLVAEKAAKVRSARQFLIRPEGFSIPKDATRVHGITTERALAEGVGLKGALEAFVEAARSAKVVVAHNLAFDEKILGAEFLRAGVANPLPKLRRVCTMESTTAFVGIPATGGRRGFKWPTLAELHRKLFGEDFSGAHGARVDVEVCAKCFFELRVRGVIGK